MNDLCHGNSPKSEEAVVNQIKWEVRSKIMAKGGFKKSALSAKLVQL
jgi:hypothetical protein